MIFPQAWTYLNLWRFSRPGPAMVQGTRPLGRPEGAPAHACAPVGRWKWPSKLVKNMGRDNKHLGKFHHDRTLFSRTLEEWLGFGELSHNVVLLQVSELL